MVVKSRNLNKRKRLFMKITLHKNHRIKDFHASSYIFPASRNYSMGVSVCHHHEEHWKTGQVSCSVLLAEREGKPYKSCPVGMVGTRK